MSQSNILEASSANLIDAFRSDREHRDNLCASTSSSSQSASCSSSSRYVPKQKRVLITKQEPKLKVRRLDDVKSTRPPRAGKKWCDSEDDALTKEVHSGMSYDDIAKKHERTSISIKSHIRKIILGMQARKCTDHMIMKEFNFTKEQMDEILSDVSYGSTALSNLSITIHDVDARLSALEKMICDIQQQSQKKTEAVPPPPQIVPPPQVSLPSSQPKRNDFLLWLLIISIVVLIVAMLR